MSVHFFFFFFLQKLFAACKYISATSKFLKQLFFFFFFFIHICDFMDHISEHGKEESVKVSGQIPGADEQTFKARQQSKPMKSV